MLMDLYVSGKKYLQHDFNSIEVQEDKEMQAKFLIHQSRQHLKDSGHITPEQSCVGEVGQGYEKREHEGSFQKIEYLLYILFNKQGREFRSYLN